MRRVALSLLCALVSLPIARGAVAVLPSTVAAPPIPMSFKGTFTGTIGKDAVVMILERKGRRLTGRYRSIPPRAQHYPPNAGHWLDGSVGGDGRFTLQEEAIDETGRSSATLAGRLLVDTAPQSLLLVEGRRSQRDARPRSLPLAARERRPTEAEARIDTIKWQERDRLWKRIIVAAYPELREAAGADQAFNTDARRVVETGVKVFKKAVSHLLPEEAERLSYEQTFAVRHADDRIVSLRFDITSHCAGPHPTTDVQGLVFDRVTGKRMKLQDLFLPGSPYRKVLSSKLGRAPHTIKQSFANWHMDVHGLWFAFVDGLEADNTCEHFVPWTELRPLVDPAGPAGPFVTGPVSGP